MILTMPPHSGRRAGWITIGALCYTTILLLLTGFQVYGHSSVIERYPIGPDVSLNLLADGLSLPVALIVNIICLALAFYSLPYVNHRVELIYQSDDRRIHGLYSKRFFPFY